MARLSDLFVSVRADDSPANKVIAGVRKSLRSLDAEKVEPSITVPEKPIADIKALESRLSALARNRVRLNVDSTTAAAEVSTLARQLETLQVRRHSIPVELQSDINRQIAEVESALAAASRRRTKIPLQLERIDAQVAAVRSQIDSLSGDGVDVPVRLTGVARVKAALAGLKNSNAKIDVDILATSGGEPFNPAEFLKVPALIGAANVAGAAVASLGAGFISLTAAAAPALGVMAAYPVALAAVQQGAGVVRLSLMGVGDVMSAQEAMQKKVASGAKISKQEQAAYNKVLEDAGPAVVNFTRHLGSAQSGFDGVRKAVQATLLPAFGDALGRLSATYLPVLRTQLVGTASVLAGLTDRFSWALTSQVWVRDLNTIMSANTRIIGTLGAAALPLANILRNVWVAALPMTERFAGAVRDAAFQISVATTNARKSGALGDFFERAYETAAQLGRIVGNLAVGLFRVFSGGVTQGQGFLDLFERLTARFAAWTGSLAGRNAIVDFFARAQPVLNEVGRLISDVAVAFAGLSTQSDLAPLIRQFRVQLLPAVLAIVNSLDDRLLPAMLGLVTRGAEFFNVMSGHSGSLTLTIGLLTKFADAALWLLDNVPGATTALGAFFAVMAVKQAATIAASVTGLTGMASAILGIKTQTGPAAAALLSFTTASGRATMAENLRAIATRAAAIASGIGSVALRGLGVAVRFALGPIGLIITAIGLLVAGVVYAYKNFEPFRKIVDTVGNALKTGLLAAIRAVGPAWTALSAATVKAWNTIKSAVSTAWTAIVGFLVAAGKTVVAPVVAAWNAVRAGTAGAFAAIRLVIETVMKAISTVIRTYLAIIGTAYSLAWQGLKIVASAAFNFIKDRIVAPIWKAISTLFASAQAALSRAWSVFWTGVRTVASTVWNFVHRNIIAPIWALIRSVFTSAQNTLRAAWTTFWNAVRTTASTVWNFVHRNIIAPVWAAIRSVFTVAQSALRASWSTFWGAVRTTATTIFNAIRSVISSVWGQIRSVWSSAQSAVRGIWSSFWGTIKQVGSDAIGAVRSRIESVFGQIRTGTQNFVGAVGRIFNGIRSAFSGPWDWVKRNVFDRIAAAYNKVAGVVGAPKLNLADGGPVGNNAAQLSNRGTSTAVAAADGGEIPKRAYGGRIRGMGGPRQDNIAGIDRATGVQTSWVSAGEFVVNAKQYQKNRDIVEAINGGLDVQTPSMRAADRAARRALGGLIPKLWLGGGTKPAAGSVSKHSGYSWARWAGDINEPGSADIGHPVVAYKAGVIAGIKSLTTSYGKHIRMNHAGNERTLYAHLSRFNVSPGQRVSEGQKIGEKGNTGNSSGPHLHFELAGGNSSIMEKISNAVSSVLEMIKPQEMFRTAAGPILRLIQAGYSRIPGAGTPFGQLLGRMPQKVVDMLANKLPASFGIETGEASSSPNGSGGLGPRARAARAYVVDRWGITNIGGYANRNIAGTNTLSKHALGKAIDIMNSNVSRGNEIANYFAGPGRGKFGVDNVIWNRRIHNQRGWHGYNGVSPHTDHVHVDFFKNGGEIPGLAAGGLVKGGRGGTLAHIGEGTRDELVTPLPRGWSMGRGGGADDKLERLIALIESGAIGGNHVEITAYNPLPEKTSQSANKGLQRGAALGLV